MKPKPSKTYSLAQVGKLLGVARSSIYNYILAGLIRVLPRTPGKKEGRRVTEAEFDRLKRNGINPIGIKAAIAKRGASAKKKPAKRGAPAAVAKKQTKRGAPAVVAKKQTKRGAPAAVAKKKPAKRSAPAAVAKKQTKRGAPAPRTAAKKRAKRAVK